MHTEHGISLKWSIRNSDVTDVGKGVRVVPFKTGQGRGSRMTCHVSRANDDQCWGGYLNVSPLVHGTARATACLLAESTGLAPGPVVPNTIQESVINQGKQGKVFYHIHVHVHVLLRC